MVRCNLMRLIQHSWYPGNDSIFHFEELRNTQARLNISSNVTQWDLKQCLLGNELWTLDFRSRYPETISTFTVNLMRTYETIEKVGKGTFYTECDGISRFRFTEPPTSQITKTITVEKSYLETDRSMVESARLSYMSAGSEHCPCESRRFPDTCRSDCLRYRRATTIRGSLNW